MKIDPYFHRRKDCPGSVDFSYSKTLLEWTDVDNPKTCYIQSLVISKVGYLWLPDIICSSMYTVSTKNKTREFVT